jgi:hypothetical protein
LLLELGGRKREKLLTDADEAEEPRAEIPESGVNEK